MPPKKRTLDETDAKAQSKQNSKRSKQQKKESNKRPTEEIDDGIPSFHISKRPPFEYICIEKFPHMGERNEDEDDAEMWNTLAADHPGWPYTMMADSWRNLCEYVQQVEYTDPEKFDMWIWSDFHAYGAFELLENMLIDFDKAHKKKDLNHMWSIVSMMGHWLNFDRCEIWLNIDDGPRSSVAFGLLGIALLTALDEIDRIDELRLNSKYCDVGLVMALFLKMSIFPAEIPLEDEDLFWRPHVVAYAKKAGIDLAKQGIDDLDQPLDQFKDVEPLKRQKTGDRWDWAGKYRELNPIGGDSHNILKFTRQKRANYAYEKKDRLREFSVKDLREGNITIAYSMHAEIRRCCYLLRNALRHGSRATRLTCKFEDLHESARTVHRGPTR